MARKNIYVRKSQEATWNSIPKGERSNFVYEALKQYEQTWQENYNKVEKDKVV